MTFESGAALKTTDTVAVCGFPSASDPDTVPKLKPAISSSKILIT